MSDTIGTRILQLRGERTQQQVADALGVSRELVKAWECGARRVKSEDVVKLARYFGVPTDYLLCVEGSVPSLDVETRAICKALGISREAAESLRLWTALDLDLAGRFVSAGGFGPLIEALGQLEKDREQCERAVVRVKESLAGGDPDGLLVDLREYRRTWEIDMYKLWEALRALVRELVPFEALLDGELRSTEEAQFEALSREPGAGEG